MRILVYSAVDRLLAGGAQTVIFRLLASLRRRGHVVMEAWMGPGPDRAAAGWVCPVYVRPPPDLRGSRSRRHHVPSLARVALGLARRRPQIVNVHFIAAPAFYFVLLKNVFGYKTLLSAHGSDIVNPRPDERDLLPDLLRRADAVTVVSENLRERVLAFPGVDPAKVRLIPNGVDCGFWSPRPPASRSEASPPTIVAVGRLEHVKGFDVLLTAMARVRQSVPAARLCVVGDGTLSKDLERQVRCLGLQDAVELAGPLDKEGVRERLRDAAVFVLPSRSEGMPLALLEAMGCGLPAVATRVGGVPEAMGAETGVLVPPEAPQELADALVGVLRDPQLASRLGDAARRRAEAFSSAVSDAAYERLYRELIEKGA